MVYDLDKYSGKPMEYVTEQLPGSGSFVQAQVVSSWIDTDEECMNGYEWQGIRSVISSDQPCCWVLSYEDYYTAEQYDRNNVECGLGNGSNYKRAEFSLTYNGRSYTECRLNIVITPVNACETRIDAFYCVPKGFDGCVLGFHNSSALTQEQIEKGMSDPAASLGLIKRADGDVYMRLK